MSVLVVGLNHRSAPVRLLERVSAGVADLPATLRQMCAAEAVREAVLLSTCNRVEAYVDVERFHPGVGEITQLLSRCGGVARDELAEHLYVHYEDRAVQHLFTVACGLDSMVVGEAQVLGQLRTAYGVARDCDAAGRLLHELFQSALRVGKRAHAETDIDRVGVSLVGMGLQLGAATLGTLAGRSALLVGAGSMSALAGASLRRSGIGELVVANRTAANAQRLATALEGEGIGLARLAEALGRADVVVACTGATGSVVPADLVADAVRGRDGRPLFLLDLALPRDIDPAAREIPGVTLTDLDTLRGVLEEAGAGADVEGARRIVAAEVGSFLAWQRSVRVAPTVVALRSKAADVVEAELSRLVSRLPELDDRARAEVAAALRRVVEKLLHTPTVRVKELAEGPGGDHYAEALRELFELDPKAPAAVAQVAVGLADGPS